MPANGGLIFISCGQVTSEEKKLGKDICKLVRDLTPHEPYFAEQQSSVEAFTKYILGNLDRAVALIAVIHPRGTVTFIDENGKVQNRVRASVWIEQELAISAYVTQILSVPLTVKAYIKEGVAREGMRDQLPLNPIPFNDESEVLEDLKSVLPGWRIIPASIKITAPPKVSVKLLKAVSSEFLLEFTNRTGEIVHIREIRFFWQNKTFMEPWIPPLPNSWMVSTSQRRTVPMMVYQENPVGRLVMWNSQFGLVFQTDIEIAFDCELLGQVREVKETLRVKVSAGNNSMIQL
jgi:hypothetical protein